MTLKDVTIRYRRVFITIANVFFISIAYIVAFFIRFEFKLPVEYYSLILQTLPFLIFIKMIFFYYFGLYSGLWKYVSMEDLWQIIKANTVSTVTFNMFVVFTRGLAGFPRSVFLLDWMLCIGLVSGVRFFTRSLREKYTAVNYKTGSIRTVIIGAGEAGLVVLRELRKNKEVEVVGFIDDDPAKNGRSLHGRKVLGNRNNIDQIVDKYRINQIIMAIPSASGKVTREMISLCQFVDVKIKIVPGLQEIFSGEMEIKLKDVQPEDLLGRESVEIDKEDISRYLKGKVILVTGGAGSIGSEIARQVLKFGPSKLVIVDYNENDLYFLEREIRDKYPDIGIFTVAADVVEISVLKATFSRFRPDIVFHAAAFKHVPLMEENSASAVLNNIIGSRNLIYASEHYGVERFVLISSDKAVNPTNVMGATKRIAEMIMQAKAQKSRTKFIAVRFGNVLGSKGSVVPLFRKQIEEERRVTITHPEARRFFMSAKEAVQLVLQAGSIGRGGEIFILDMGEQINITDFARNLIGLSGLKPERDVAIEYIGLRPGEKLYEETLHDIEKDQATKHEKIFIAKPNDINSNKLQQEIKELERLANLMDNDKILEKISEIVPAYIPSQGKNTY
jgi:FlaA1/EpsC-like NDP-sugar epimerase